MGEQGSRGPRAAPGAGDGSHLHGHRGKRTPTPAAGVPRAEARCDALGDRARDRDLPGLEPPLPLRAERSSGASSASQPASRSTRPRSAAVDRGQVAQPVVVSAELVVGEGREADPTGAGKPARDALDGPLGLRRGHPRHDGRRARSATRSRTAASACTSATPSGSSTTSTSARRSSSSRRDVTSRPRRAGSRSRARLGLFGLLDLEGRAADPTRPRRATGSPRPDFTLSRIGGPGDLQLSSLRGKAVVVNFWASWCSRASARRPRSRLSGEAPGRARRGARGGLQGLPPAMRAGSCASTG